ncbi:MAG TPA: hypothetical protein QGG51_04480, partial [Candidatus Pelagibacter bacterium]|nr:hypothetical protein [Candidatus Pelagibacter bacterium]
MSLKSLIQIIIILIIIIILGGVYFNYFENNKKISLENKEKKIQTEIDINKPKKKETKNLSDESSVKTEINVSTEVKEVKNENMNLKKKLKPNKPKINNMVKDIEYLTTDKSGNKYKILATSGRSNSEDNDILDLDNV